MDVSIHLSIIGVFEMGTVMPVGDAHGGGDSQRGK
jgi:hypothetical protein